MVRAGEQTLKRRGRLSRASVCLSLLLSSFTQEWLASPAQPARQSARPSPRVLTEARVA